MRRENRLSERYENMGRVEASELCALPAVLDDISLTGCRVHFPVPVKPDMERDYNLVFKLTGKDTLVSLELTCHPQWMNEDEQSMTFVGFSFLPSPGTPQLKVFIDKLHEAKKNPADVSDLLIESSVSFV